MPQLLALYIGQRLLVQPIEGLALLVRQGWERFHSFELRSRWYRSGLKNQMISRVVNQASKTPRAIETSASTTGIQRTSAGAGYPQYGVLIKGRRVNVNGQSRTGLSLSLSLSLEALT